ncbi:TlpA disulfide reductase family protein [Chitinophaga pollutisoli]|uniref:TlpA disulfide reductase family protein n=1 Tax=Chitinophaga pollutisoli TaxID=3133966 RepID=A0ABZ2YVD2_9BACT
MKRILTGMALLSCITGYAQEKLEITAKLGGMKDGERVLFWMPLGDVRDSTFVKDGSFSKTINMTGGGTTCIIHIGEDMNEAKGMFLYVEPGKLNFTGKGPYFDDAEITGSPFVEEWKQMDMELAGLRVNDAKLSELEAEVAEAMSVGDADAKQAIEAEMWKLKQANAKTAMDWLMQHPNVGAGSYLVNVYLSVLPRAEFLAFAEKLGPKVRNTHTVKYMIEQRTGASVEVNASLGKAAPGFTLEDVDGKKFSLSDFKGKYVLVDFWASWCKPCREQNPKLVEMHNKFKSKGLEVVSISIDDDREKWKQAVKEDQLSWLQLIGDAGRNSKIMKDYKVIGIPLAVLIDKNGNLLKIGLRGDNLEAELNALIK